MNSVYVEKDRGESGILGNYEFLICAKSPFATNCKGAFDEIKKSCF